MRRGFVEVRWAGLGGYFDQNPTSDEALDLCEVDPRLGGPNPSVAMGGAWHSETQHDTNFKEIGIIRIIAVSKVANLYMYIVVNL